MTEQQFIPFNPTATPEADSFVSSGDIVIQGSSERELKQIDDFYKAAAHPLMNDPGAGKAETLKNDFQTELVSGPEAKPSEQDKLALSQPANKQVAFEEMRKTIALTYLEGHQKQLEAQAQYNLPEATLSSKEFLKNQKRIRKYVENIMDDTEEADDKRLKYLMGLAYKGFHIPEEELHAWATSLNFVLVNQIKKGSPLFLQPFIDEDTYAALDSIIPGGNITDKITWGDGLTAGETKQVVKMVDHYASTLDRSPELQKALKILDSSKGDELLRKFWFEPMKHIDGDKTVDLAASNLSDAMVNAWNDFFGGDIKGSKNQLNKRKVDWEEVNKELVRVHGPDWQGQIAAYLSLLAYAPTKAVAGVGKITTRMLLKADRRGIVAGKALVDSLRSPGKFRKTLMYAAEGAAFMGAENAIKTGTSALSSDGMREVKIKDIATDMYVGALAGGGLFAMLDLMKFGGKKVWKVAEAMYEKQYKAAGEMLHVSPVEQLAVESTEALQTLRKTELGMADESTGFTELIKNTDDTFGPLFRVANEVHGLTKTRRGGSAAGQVEYLSYVDLEREGVRNLYASNVNMLLDDDATLGMILNETANTPRNLIQKIETNTAGFVGLQKLSADNSVDQINKYITTPRRRFSEKLVAQTIKQHDEIRKKTSLWNRGNFDHALRYSDQKQTLLDRGKLQSMFSLDDNDIKQYYELHRLFNRMWVDLNTSETTVLSKAGFKALNDNLDGHGQQSIVKIRELGNKFYTARTPQDAYDSLPNKVKEFIDTSVPDSEVTWLSLIESLRSGSSLIVDEHRISTGLPASLRFVSKSHVTDITRPLGYNPGFFGGIRYEDMPVMVVAVNKNLYSKVKDVSAKSSQKPVLHIGGSSDFVSSQRWINGNKEKWGKRGYDLYPIRSGKEGSDVQTILPDGIVDSIGKMDESQAAAFAKNIAGAARLDDAQTGNLMEALTRAAMAPHLRSRGSALRNFNFDERANQWRGRIMYKGDGSQVIRKDLAPVLAPKEAAVDYIKKYVNTITKGNFIKTLKTEYSKEFKDIVVDVGGRRPGDPGFNIFSKLSAASTDPLPAEKFKHAKAVQELISRLSISSSPAQRKLQNIIQAKAETLAKSDNLMVQEMSRMLDTLGIDARWNPLSHKGTALIKGTGTSLAFLANASTGIQQLAPTVLAYSRIGLSKNPADVVTITGEAVGMVYGTLLRVMGQPGKGMPKGLKIKERELYDSFILGEMRHLEELGDMGQKVRDLSMAFFYAGEGLGRTISFVAARKEVEREFLRATKIGAVGKLEHTKWMSKDGRLTKDGLIEVAYRANEMFFNMTREEAPQLALGYTGVLAQFFANVTAHTSHTFYTNVNSSLGRKLKYALGTTALFGPLAMPYFGDIFSAAHLVSKAFKGAESIQQKEEALDDAFEFFAGYIAAEYDLDDEKETVAWIKNSLKNGMVGYSLDQQWNVTSKMTTGFILSNFLSNNYKNFEVFAKGVITADPGEFMRGASGLAGPAPKLIHKNIESASDAIMAIMQTYENIHPKGSTGSIVDSIANGVDEDLLKSDVDNIRYQATKNIPGLGNVFAVMDTFGANQVGEEIWKNRQGQAVNPETEWQTRFKLLTGMGKNAKEATFEMAGVRYNKIEAIKLRGRQIAKMRTSGNIDQSAAEYQKQVKELVDSGDTTLLPNFIQAHNHELLKPYLTEDTQKILEMVKGIGIHSLGGN